jgi:molybdopterin-containing oxidoreductase family iron-sulfur binding subunit
VDENGGRAWLTERARVSATGRHRRLPLLQTSDNQRGRQIGEALPLAALTGAAGVPDEAHGGHGGGHGDGHAAAHEMRVPYDPAADAANAQLAKEFPNERSVKESPYRWGMTVDLDRCTGCSACIAACYVENNIPVVGEDETRRVRQMAWLRIDRFVGAGEPELEAGRVHPAESRERLGQVDVRNTPLLCQQCGSAPCEPVCPVIATYHNEEGLNAMIYNRCIGTRYCANNCPYKVRRFNYFDNQLTKWPSPMELGLNPDVTVRGQGVMEKCNFCVQRIQVARQAAKAEGRTIGDGEVRTACQQTCPSDAIAFGNLRDPASEVSRRAGDEKRGYHALHMLNTRPAVTYLAKVLRGEVEG